MRRLLAFFVLCACSLLMAAAPKVAPKPTPSPTPTPPPFASTQPVVMIFPFDTPSDVDAKYGLAVANIYGQVLSEAGGVTVLAIAPKIRREDYQTYAHIHHADYYISGFIQPIGSAASIVTQVVDVSTDIDVYPATTQVTDVQDIGSQALNALTAIREAAGVDRPELQEDTSSASTPQPQATTGGASIGIGSIVSDLFKGKPKGKGAPKSTPTPQPPKPQRGVIVAGLLGNAPAQTLHAASDSLFSAMNQHYHTVMSAQPTKNLTTQATNLCGSNRDNTIASGLLDVQHVGGFHPHDSYTFTFNVYACFGVVLYTVKETNDNFNRAVHDAVESYYGEHPENNG